MPGKVARAMLVPVAIVAGVAAFFLVMFLGSITIPAGVGGVGLTLLVVLLGMSAAAVTGRAVVRLGRSDNPEPTHPGGEPGPDQPRPANPDAYKNLPQFPG